jgi:hypothetical protein
MTQKTRRRFRARFWILLVLAFLLVDLLVSGPYRGLARNQRVSRETYSQLQPLFLPAQYVSQVPLLDCMMGAYWDWWTKILRQR